MYFQSRLLLMFFSYSRRHKTCFLLFIADGRTLNCPCITAYHSGEEKHTTHYVLVIARNVVYERSGPISLELVVTAPWCLFKLNLLPFLYITPSPPSPHSFCPSTLAVFLVLLLFASKPNKNSETGTLSESFNARGTVQMATSCSFLFSRFKHNSPLYKFFWPRLSSTQLHISRLAESSLI